MSRVLILYFWLVLSGSDYANFRESEPAAGYYCWVNRRKIVSELARQAPARYAKAGTFDMSVKSANGAGLSRLIPA